jgi:lysine 2,3-aminomutase
MTSWETILNNSITSPQAISTLFACKQKDIEQVTETYPARINPYYLNLIKQHGTALYKQAVPDIAELEISAGMRDPLDEENLSPVANLVHKYPDRALFLVSRECAMYCRFCTRKRKVGRKEMIINRKTIQDGLDYLKKTTSIREVLLSGGDPLMLSDLRLDKILASLRAIPSIEIIRIGTRMPCTLPMRITPGLVKILKKYHPLYINTHFNHPAEISREATKACTMLVDAGIPVGCQSVLLKGVNDNPQTMTTLMRKLLAIRVKPYYLFQADFTRGTGHFRTSIETGKNIMQSMIGHISGMAIPTYAIDAPGGGGKIPLTPDYITRLDGDMLEFNNYKGQPYCYPVASE